jgi:hypothetical protein
VLNFPLDLRFKIIAIAPQISVTDAAGTMIGYVKQKAFKLKEAVTVFSDASQSHPLYRIAADRILDISAQYHVTAASGTLLGSLQRHGMRSIWSAHYDILRDGGVLFQLREENPWVKVIDGVLGEIPIVGLLSSYLFHPAYRVTRAEGGVPVMRSVKQPALFEGRFKVERLGEMTDEEERLALLGVLMLLLLERDRG